VDIVYRSADWDTPWWARPHRGPGRFNRPGSDPTQYLSEHPLTVFAERVRGLGRPAVADLDTMRWRCWAMALRLEDLTPIGFDSARRFGIEPDELVGDDWAPCHDLADRLRAEGVPGIVVPSAALPGTRNVVVFGARVASPYLLDPIDPDLDVATAHVAERSVPPGEVVPLVRFHGEPHAELEAWRKGKAYVFREPAPIGP